uniref:Somatostatin/Cortistatin C-terminal domain-containing protein n=1 Tax=Echeneis naucrates TaxID=173247 RepID=A0A665TNJ8_ECHNA
MAYILCILVLLCFVTCVVENTNNEQRFKDLQLQEDFVPWLSKLQDQENFVDLLYDFLKSENGITPKEHEDGEKEEKSRRGLRSGYTKRIGCRTFFWKAWTAC